MPHCAVIWCNNQSKNVNKQNSGVSYHKFPNDPYVKDKWILATGKYNWFPQKHDTICSVHFEAVSFMKRSNRTYLSSDAVPTLKLHPLLKEVTGEESHVESTEGTFKCDISNNQFSPQARPEVTNTPNIQDTLRRNAEEESVHRVIPILCNNCQKVIVGFRYKCITCENYDLCRKCEMMETHSEHYVLRIPKPLKCEEATEVVQQIFKPDEDIPLIKEENSIGDSIEECRYDVPIQEDNVDGDIHSSQQIKNVIHIDVSRVMEEGKDIGEPPATVRRKNKRTLERETGGGGKRMCDAAAEVNAAPEVIADANSDFDTQVSSIVVEIKQEMCEDSEIISTFDVGETENPYVKEEQL